MAYYNYRGVLVAESGPESGNIKGTSAGGETIQAPAGNTAISGEGGGDTLIGSSGDNRFFITDRADIIREAEGGGTDTVVAYVSWALAPNVENLVVHGDFNYAVGNSLSNLIVVDGAQWVYGGAGDDVLVGSDGQRTTFVVRAGEGNDVIYNWQGNAQLQLLDYSFTSGAQVRAAMVQTGADVVLKLSATETLTFRDATIDEFTDRQLLLPLDRSQLGQLTFGDEFNTLSLHNPSTGEGTWNTNFGGNLKDAWAYTLVSNGERQAYVDQNFQGRGEGAMGVNPFSVVNGVATISASELTGEQSQAAYGATYASGMLNTLGSFSQKYGYFEMRAEVPNAAGAWPAFWLLPSPYQPGMEADIMEGLGATPNVDYRRAYGGEGGSETQYDNALKIDAGGFHTYGMLWTATKVSFYYDGVKVLEGPTPSTWTSPMSLIINLAVGGWGGEPDAGAFPAKLNIDYVHVYALADGSSKVVESEPEAPVATLTAAGTSTGATAVELNTPDGDIVILAAKPTEAADGDFVVWESGGAVFGAVAHGGALGAGTPLMAGSSSMFTGAGVWLTNGKVVVGYVKDGEAWSLVFDPKDNSFVRQELGDGGDGLTFVATRNGGFAASWEAPDGTIMARGYDDYAYGGDVPGWYGPAREVSGAVSGVTADGKLIAGDQLYVLERASQLAGTPVSLNPITIVHNEGDAGLVSYAFVIKLAQPAAQTSSVSWSVTGSGDHPASAADFEGGMLPVGVVNFAVGEQTKTIIVKVAGDTVAEMNETFKLSLSNPIGVTLQNSSVLGLIVNDDGAVNPTAGQPYVSTGPNSTLAGGAGDDTLVASQGGDTLTGGAGADTFRLSVEPWSPVHITDFKLGVDKLDLTALFQKAGYTGTNPVGDHFISFIDDGAGGTKVIFDRDGPGSSPVYGGYAVQLDGVPTAGLTWAALSGGTTTAAPSGGNPPASAPPPPPAGAGVVLTSDSYADTLTGGAKDDTLNAGQGPDVLTGGAGADHFVYADLPWSAGRITDFTVGQDVLDLRGLLSGYSGADPIADGHMRLEASGGDTLVYVDPDGPGGEWATLVTTLVGVRPADLSSSDWIIR
jgi:beta-glucanase (GH16 family)